MSNINDYLIWRGDIPINDAFEFNEVDSMILARFSYLIFDKINLKNKETIASISSKMKDFVNEDFRYNGDKELITNLGQSLRFKNMIVTDFVEHKDKEVEKQFGAITIHNSDNEMYLSFIGTDSSIVGWKEDFNLSFMTNIPAQLEGKKYTEILANKYPNKRIRIGGHSKGGNVAVYSAFSVSQDIQDRIIKVYNYDGPGFPKSVLENNKNKKLVSRIATYIPQDSVIGRILEHEEKYEVVQSIEKGLYQHDIYSWQIIRDELVTLEKVTNSSEMINVALRKWLNETTPEQRKIFFDGIFRLFYSTSANTFGEFSSSLVKNMPTIMKTYKQLSENDRKIIISMLKEFGKASAKSIKEQETKNTEQKKKTKTKTRTNNSAKLLNRKKVYKKKATV